MVGPISLRCVKNSCSNARSCLFTPPPVTTTDLPRKILCICSPMSRQIVVACPGDLRERRSTLKLEVRSLRAHENGFCSCYAQVLLSSLLLLQGSVFFAIINLAADLDVVSLRSANIVAWDQELKSLHLNSRNKSHCPDTKKGAHKSRMLTTNLKRHLLLLLTSINFFVISTLFKVISRAV